MKKLIDSSILIAFGTGVLFVIGGVWDQRYLSHLGVPVAQFVAPPERALLNGFNYFYEIVRQWWPWMIPVAFGAISYSILIGTRWFPKYRRKVRITRRTAKVIVGRGYVWCLIPMGIVFIVLLHADHLSKELAQRHLSSTNSDLRKMSFEVVTDNSTNVIEGTFLVYGDDRYAVLQPSGQIAIVKSQDVRRMSCLDASKAAASK